MRGIITSFLPSNVLAETKQIPLVTGTNGVRVEDVITRLMSEVRVKDPVKLLRVVSGPRVIVVVIKVVLPEKEPLVRIVDVFSMILKSPIKGLRLETGRTKTLIGLPVYQLKQLELSF